MASKDLPFQYEVGRRSIYVARGDDIKVENVNAYVCQAPYNTDKAVIIVHDIYGWQFPDTRFVADIVAANGFLTELVQQTLQHFTAVPYRTICPDFFLGKAPWKSSDHWQDFADWLKQREPTKVDKTTDIIIKYLKEQCKVTKIGIVGFSWGGMAVHHLMLKNPELNAGVSFYGIIRNSEDRYKLLNPTFFAFGQHDHTISLDQVTLLEQKLKEYCTVPYKIKVYPGQYHGFAQGKPEDSWPKDVPYMEEARMDMLDWLNKYIIY